MVGYRHEDLWAPRPGSWEEAVEPYEARVRRVAAGSARLSPADSPSPVRRDTSQDAPGGRPGLRLV